MSRGNTACDELAAFSRTVSPSALWEVFQNQKNAQDTKETD